MPISRERGDILKMVFCANCGQSFVDAGTQHVALYPQCPVCVDEITRVVSNLKRRLRIKGKSEEQITADLLRVFGKDADIVLKRGSEA